MGRNSNGTATFALFIAIIGVGLGGYAVFYLPDITLQEASNNSQGISDNNQIITNMWTDEQDATYYTTSSYAEVPDLELIITVNTSETVYVLFNAYFEGNTGVLSGSVRLTLDNTVITKSIRTFTIDCSLVISGCSLTSQFILEGLDAGEYEIEVEATGVGTSDKMLDGNLMIYTFK